VYTDTPAQRAVLRTLDMMTEAKATLVAVDGIGSELLPAMVAYEGTDPIGYAILTDPPPSNIGIYRRISECAGLMVAGWHATGLALALESYAQDTAPFDNGPANTDATLPSLADRYTTDPTIREALWVAYADRLGGRSMGVQTYTQTVGRTVNFDEPTYSNPNQHADFDEPGTFPHLLTANLAHLQPRPMPDGATRHQARQAIATQLDRIGFSTFLDPA